MKSLASIASLGTGFRGGLFFASLLIGALGGRIFADVANMLWPAAALDPHIYAIIGMGALSVSVIGGPLTMTFIALETTGDYWLTAAVLIAIIVSAQVTRQQFGYSFATWRFHLRGEGIRSAADVGWVRELTVRRMMRSDVRTVPAPHHDWTLPARLIRSARPRRWWRSTRTSTMRGSSRLRRRTPRTPTRRCRCARSCISRIRRCCPP